MIVGCAQNENVRVLKMDMRFPYRNSISWGVIDEDDTMGKFYGFKNQYTQVHIGTQSQAK